MGVLCRWKRDDKKILTKKIHYALEFIRNNEFDDEEGLKEAIVPLLILENCDDELSKRIIQEIKNLD